MKNIRILTATILIILMASMVAFGAPVYVNVGPTTEFDGDIKILSEIVAEGTTPDDWETTIFFTDPTADRTITIPDADVTVGVVTGIVPPDHGGTGIANNAASTITITGAFATTITITNVTAVTFPTSGIVVSDATACTDIEGTGLSIAGGVLNWAAPNESIDSDAYVDASIDHEHLHNDVIHGMTAATPLAAADEILFWDETAGALRKITWTNFMGSITAVGTIGTGTWNATVIDPAYGGTGVANNAASTLTISGNFGTTLTVTEATALTLPASGTVATTSNKLSVFAATTSAELAGVISDETGSGALVFGTSPTFTNGITATNYILFNDTDFNTLYGYSAGKNIIEGARSNTFIGYEAGLSNAGSSTDAADTNCGVGWRALYVNQSGNSNLAFGSGTLYANTSGSSNVAVGVNALRGNTTGHNNIGIGGTAGRYQADGSTALIPSNSIYIGGSSKGYDNNDDNTIVIGYQAIGKGANTTVLGNSSITDTYLYGKVHAESSAFIHTVVTLGDTDTTPDVSGGEIFISQSNTGATAITDLDNPTVGQTVTIICGDANNPPSIADGGNFKMEGNWTSDIDDSITFFVSADNYYIELSRSAN